MLSRSALCLFLLLVGSSAFGQNADLPQGSICGTVLNENGSPASAVKVSPDYLGPHSGVVPFARTDELGRYCLTGLALGDYYMTADDPEKGYPSTASGFFSTEPKRSQVKLSSTNLNGRADWKIPYKAGFVKVELVDAQSGKQIVPMFFELLVQSRPEVGHMFGSAGSTTPLLVPPDQDVVVTIHAPGYRQGTDKEPQRTVVNLRPGEIKKLHIALQLLEVAK
jgi:hypothetical protein